MNQFYIYAFSSPTKKHPDNKFGDFTVSLPHSIDLKDERWRVGLCDITCIGDTSVQIPDIFICTDVILSNFDSTTSLPILRFVNRQTSPMQKVFPNVYYCDLKSKQIDTVRLYLKTKDKNTPSVANTVLGCTLHFKRDGKLSSNDTRQ